MTPVRSLAHRKSAWQVWQSTALLYLQLQRSGTTLQIFGGFGSDACCSLGGLGFLHCEQVQVLRSDLLVQALRFSVLGRRKTKTAQQTLRPGEISAV